MYEIVWEFQPAPGRGLAFESAYGEDGAWAELFRRDPGYLGTELIPPPTPGGWYRTITRWESAAAYERFGRAWGREYDALDRPCGALTSEERPVSGGSPVA